MRRKNVFVLTVLLLMTSLFLVRLNTVEVKAFDGMETSKVYGVEMLWNNSMSVNDVAVSKDGNYLVAVNNTGIYYFAANNSSPKWWFGSPNAILSVAISADGECVVAGDSSGFGFLYYFNDSRSALGPQASSTWRAGVGDHIERRRLDMSDNGEYVAVRARDGVTDLYYFAGCRGRSGTSEAPTWLNRFDVYDFSAVDISSDGKHVAVGATDASNGNSVFFYKDADLTPYPTNPDWIATTSLYLSINDVTLSDDGYSVAAIDYEHLYYWANATGLSGDPNATWTGDGYFFSLDISSDGDDVIGGMGLPMPCGLHFWTGARVRSGSNQTEDWIRFEGSTVWDVAISNDGGITAASVENASSYKALFFKSDGSIIGEFDLVQYSPLVSMSGDSSVTAIGGSVIDSLYVFKTLGELTPPAIANVYQQPANDSVTPDGEVMVYANVTDDQSGVKKVILSYTTDNETYFIVNMTNFEGNLWNGSIPVFPYCTWVDYNIIAEDMAGNTITTGELLGYWYQYHVIPEFSSVIILPLFMIATLIAVIVYKRKHAI